MIDRILIALQSSKHRPNYWIAIFFPVFFAVSQFYLRSQAGPFWQWNLLDPSYFYLLDGLNLLNGDTPGHVYHPGATVHAFNAILISLHEFITSDQALRVALAEPEKYLLFLSDAIISLNSLALILVGVIGYRVFGDWLSALLCQSAPFASSIVLKHAFLPKPEALLIFSTILIALLILLSWRARYTDSYFNPLALGFGTVVGFIFATKVTAAPLFLLPLFLLRGTRSILIYSVMTFIAFAFFCIPVWEAAGNYFDWLMRIASGVGPYGTGQKGIIELDRYFSGFIKILKRPSLNIPLILMLLAFALTVRQHRKGRKVALKDLWIVIGISAAQLGQTVIVAKQPTAFYMIPSYMLANISLLFSIRVIWQARPNLSVSMEVARPLVSLLFATFFLVQLWSVNKLANHFHNLHSEAMKIDNDKFKHCARIYNYAASSPVFALYLADHVTGSRFAEVLKRLLPDNDFWIDDWWDWQPVRLRNWDGVQNITEVINKYPCVLMRGTSRKRTNQYLLLNKKDILFGTECSKGNESVWAFSVDCFGRLKK